MKEIRRRLDLQHWARGAVWMGLAFPGAFSGCSSSPSNPDYDMVVVDRKSDRQVTVEYDGKCAMGVAQGRMDIPGNKDTALQYEGKTYYFANEAAKVRFEQNLKANVERSRDLWAESHVRNNT